jgi:hypothetical protein
MFLQNPIQHIYYKESPIATTDDFDNSDIFLTLYFYTSIHIVLPVAHYSASYTVNNPFQQMKSNFSNGYNQK